MSCCCKKISVSVIKLVQDLESALQILKDNDFNGLSAKDRLFILHCMCVLYEQYESFDKSTKSKVDDFFAFVQSIVSSQDDSD